jgi:hypothetical protein
VAVAASITGTGLSGAADAVWNGGTHTTALATGINAGDGDDSIASTGNITATSTATTVAVDGITSTGVHRHQHGRRQPRRSASTVGGETTPSRARALSLPTPPPPA